MPDVGVQLSLLRAGVSPSSYRPPVARSLVVSRDDLVDRFHRAPTEDPIVVTAPAGYGKTTTMMLWSEADPRPFVWVHLDRLDNDPVHLLHHLALALDRLDAVDPALVAALSVPGASPRLDMLPPLLDALEGYDEVVVVLDDVHQLESPPALECVRELLDRRPAACQIALAGRADPWLGAEGPAALECSMRLAAADLAVTQDEAALFLAEQGREFSGDDLARLVEKIEGWPAGLHLVAMALKGGRRDTAYLDHEHLVFDYLMAEGLENEPAPLVRFMERSAVLDRMTADLLDRLLERDDSGLQLQRIEDSGNLFLVPLGPDGEGYRYHHLFLEALRDRLRAHEPALARTLHERASHLLEADGDIDGAIHQAVTAGDVERAAGLILSRMLVVVSVGRTELLRQWLDALGEDAIEHHTSAAIAWGWYGEATGDVALIRRAIFAAERSRDSGSTAGGPPFVDAALAILTAVAGWDGVPGVVRDSQIARDSGDASVNPWWTLATVIQGSAYTMLGQHDHARERLLEAVERAGEAPAVEAACVGYLALLSSYDDDLAEAGRMAKRAAHLMDTYRLEHLVLTVPVLPAIALIRARCGDADEARRALVAGQEVVARLDYLAPRAAFQANVLLARTALLLGDRVQARELATEAERAQLRDPSAPFLDEQLEELLAELDDPGGVVQTSDLTATELRILGYLPTHYTLGEIAKEIVVARNTVKSHCLSIYRKLGVSSRFEAVAEAQRLGILPD